MTQFKKGKIEFFKSRFACSKGEKNALRLLQKYNFIDYLYHMQGLQKSKNHHIIPIGNM